MMTRKISLSEWIANYQRLCQSQSPCDQRFESSILQQRRGDGEDFKNIVGYTSVAVTACETDHYILVVFVVMSKEEGSMYSERLHIPIVLGRMSTSASSVEMFQQI